MKPGEWGETRPRVEFVDWGTVDYAEALERQRELFDRLIAEKESPSAYRAGWLVMCEHPPVYTLGRSGAAENLLVNEDVLRAKGAALYRTERGGDITYHGPGQIVGYPIVDLDRLDLGLRDYIAALEQAVIETTAALGIEAGRIEGKTGVWIGDERGERKICAIGVKASRGVVMHGFALNVATGLEWFELINPCGFVGGAVTSVERETGRKIGMAEVKRVLREKLKSCLGIEM